MKWNNALAIYFLFFAFSTFILLPFGVRTTAEVGGEPVAGQAESAPHRFDLPRHLRRAGLLAAVLFALYYANYTQGWIQVEDIDFFNPPSASDNLAA